MKVKDVMTDHVIRIAPEESAEVAARMLTHYNIGILPVCDTKGTVCGLVTDRDLVIRCLAAGKKPEETKVWEIMTTGVISAEPEMAAGMAASLMGKHQIRRLPVVEQGRLCGMVSLGDLANHQESAYDAADALTDISSNLSVRD